MISMHLEATQNGMMLIIMAMILPTLKLGSFTRIVYEISAHIGAWCNVLPWLYGGITGAVLKMPGHGQVYGNIGAVPPVNNQVHVGIMTTALIACTIGDVISWGIVLAALIQANIKVQNAQHAQAEKSK